MKRACLVGINAYPQVPLQGCVNDVNDVAALLIGSYGFVADDMTILTDGSATRDRLERALRDLIGNARSGDRVLFHYSGHGTQMVVADAVAEAICPIDCDFGSSDNLTADKLARIFASLPAGAHFTWVCDSCYSGGLAVGPTGRRCNRYLPPPPEAQRRITEILTSGAPTFRTFVSLMPPNTAFVAGCGANEGAEDATIGDRYNGAFTYYFLHQLAMQPSSSLSSLRDVVAAQLKAAAFAQTPQLKGPPELTRAPFLS